ncbi:MAG: diacylglycerol kinase [Bacteroidetes bacterium]|nr:MAG: diacylglycerol kinase [Bacteroidota bacterium]
MKKNSVYIATSFDGYIADRNGGLDWLHSIPNPDMEDMGYASFMEKIDALVMGRVTFETVCSFDVDWPYTKPVFVLSNTLTEIPQSHQGKVFLMKGSLEEIIDEIHQKGHHHVYIDGGSTIQQFLKEDRIDEMIITTIPILLGGGASLFAETPTEFPFELVRSQTFLGQIVQNHYRRKRS